VIDPSPENVTVSKLLAIQTNVDHESGVTAEIKLAKKWLSEASNLELQGISDYKLRVDHSDWHFTFLVGRNYVRGVVNFTNDSCSVFLLMAINFAQWKHHDDEQDLNYAVKHIHNVKDTGALKQIFEGMDWTSPAHFDAYYNSNFDNLSRCLRGF
jgi:hypothetical protein